jgi:predicted phage terminase large subunit-like protein
VLEPEVEAGNWYLPEGAEWLDAWVDEFASFPLGKNDDQVDAASQVAVRLNAQGDMAHTRMLLGIAAR